MTGYVLVEAWRKLLLKSRPGSRACRRGRVDVARKYGRGIGGTGVRKGVN